MNYMNTDVINKPFISKLTKKIKLDKQMSGGEKSVLLKRLNEKFLNEIKIKFDKAHFKDEDLIAVLEYLKGE